MPTASPVIANDIYVEIDGHDMSNWFFNVDTPSTKEKIDVSGFNPAGAKSWLPGAKEDSVTLQGLQDFSASGLHDLLSDIYQNNSTVGIKIRPTSAVVSATNPQLSGNVKLYEYDGLSAAFSNRLEITVTFNPADAAGLVWAGS